MRSFTKKNTPYNESLYHLLYSGVAGSHFANLREALEDRDFREAYENLINLTNSNAIQHFVDSHKVKLTMADLNGAVISGGITLDDFSPINPNVNGTTFTGSTPPAAAAGNFPNVTVGLPATLNSITQIISQQVPGFNELVQVLTGGAGPPILLNDLNITPQPLGIDNDNINGIAYILALKQVLRYAKLRSQYENLYSYRVDPGGGGAIQIRLNHFCYNPTLDKQNQEQQSNAFQNNGSLNEIVPAVPPAAIITPHPYMGHTAAAGANAIHGTVGAGAFSLFSNANASNWTRQGKPVLNSNSFILIDSNHAKTVAASLINTAPDPLGGIVPGGILDEAKAISAVEILSSGAATGKTIAQIAKAVAKALGATNLADMLGENPLSGQLTTALGVGGLAGLAGLALGLPRDTSAATALQTALAAIQGGAGVGAGGAAISRTAKATAANQIFTSLTIPGIAAKLTSIKALPATPTQGAGGAVLTAIVTLVFGNGSVKTIQSKAVALITRTAASAPAPAPNLIAQGVRIINYLQRHYDTSMAMKDLMSLTHPPLANAPTVKDAISKGNAEVGYKQSKKPLLKAQGLYCAFCETAISAATIAHIEHKLPKSVFPTEALDWENFVLCCAVCNSTHKGQKIWDTAPAPAAVTNSNNFLNRSFQVGAMGASNYIAIRDGAKDDTLWPDLKNHGHYSFAAMAYNLYHGGVQVAPANLTVDRFREDSYITVQNFPPAAPTTYQVHLKNMTDQGGGQGTLGNPDIDDVQIRAEGIGALTQASANNIINICGLNSIGAGADPKYWNDQRIADRTKAWFHAMQSLKDLRKFYTTAQDLKTYYDQQLNPVAIGGLPTNFISSLRDTVPNNIALHPITAGNLDISTNDPVQPDGEVTWDTTAANISAVFPVVATITGLPPIAPNTAVQGRLTGSIKTVNNTRTITGRIRITSLGGAAANHTLTFDEAPIAHNALTSTEQITLVNVAVITADNANAANTLKEWDQKRQELAGILDRRRSLFIAFLWKSIINTVRLGGFYSTWVHTWKTHRVGPLTGTYSFDVELVRSLEIESIRNPEDSRQFHGTDAAALMKHLN